MLFERNNNFRLSMKEGAWNQFTDRKVLGTSSLSELEKEFLEEINRAVWKLGSDKAPFVGGFTLFFLGYFGQR